MAGSSSTLTSDEIVEVGLGSRARRIRKLTIDLVGDSANGTMPTLAIAGTGGYITQALTNPGSTGPTDNYDITLVHAEGGDVLGGALANRDIANSEIVDLDPRPLMDTGVIYTLTIANTSVNDATLRIILYIDSDR